MTIMLNCPNCGKIGMIDENSVDLVDEKIDPKAFLAPEGFRKVAHGPTSDEVFLHCCECDVPAELPVFH
ncbi:hypothetical protein P3T18_000413 [Paraburkholderia sp. GAS199]|uniref:hypothetical protein n=1 Tax=Paraburkholderia sp. GAS199 TaxID=3035126 RepID=UPI003D1BFF60